MIGKLKNKSVLITGADSGIGKAVALLFAMEGADIAIIYHSNDNDAGKTKAEIETLNRKCIIFKGDINDYEFCEETVKEVISVFGKIDILINNAGIQFPADRIEDLEEKNIRQTFDSNIVGMILLTKVVFPYLKEGSCVINTTSVSAYQGHPELLDYSATKGAIVSFTRSLALQAKPKGIRINAVAPGPVATPLTEETFDEKEENPTNLPLREMLLRKKLPPAFCFWPVKTPHRLPDRCFIPMEG
nr:SDR family NAD(P)-dependent oxidoreductase [Chryseobacterium gleum]